MKELQSYGFPGNVRQLENILERALALTTSEEIKSEDLQLSQAPARGDGTDLLGAPLPERLEDLEKKAIMQALEKTHYNRTAAAKLLFTVPEAAARLGVGRTTLYGLIADRAITPVHIGRLTRLTADELDGFVTRLTGAANEASTR